VPSWTITKHAPEEIKPVENNTINDLKKWQLVYHNK
jgi:hypothetical protein